MNGPGALLVTGTDTEIGKTVVGTALLAAWRARGLSVGAYKPVESGVGDAPADGTALWEASGCSLPLDEVCPVRLRAPLAPPVAARAEGVTLDVDDWVRRIDALRGRFDRLLVEGAGGLLSPLWDGGHAAALARRCGLPALVVAPDRLGVINHVRLVVEALERRSIPIVAVVLNRIDAGVDDDVSRATNRDEIAALIAPPVVGPLPWLPDADAAARGRALARCAGAELLLG